MNRKRGMGRSRTVSSRLAPATLAVIEAIAEEREMSLSATIRLLLEIQVHAPDAVEELRYYRSCPVPKPSPAADTRAAQRRDERRRMRRYLLLHPRCERTGCRNPSVQVHHKEPKRMGGSTREAIHGADNFEALCVEHHQAMHGIRTAP
jgi:hypothetical protein